MPTVNPVVYNHVDLHSWQEELISLEHHIAVSLQFIEQQKQFFESLQEQLNPLNLKISLIQHQINIDTALNEDDIRPETYKLLLELDELQRQAAELTKLIQPSEQAVSTTQANLQLWSLRQAWLKEHIPAAQLFLSTLQENPIASVQDLTNKIWEALSNYEDTHLTGLSPQVRICLLSVRYLNLLTSHPGYASDYTDQIHRGNYLRLCGFLWDMYTKVKEENKDVEFEGVLASLIESTHVAQDGDLPYPTLTGYNAAAWFESNKQSTPGCFAITEQDLPHLEEQNFNYGLAFLLTQNRNPQLSALQKHIINAANLIETEVRLKKQKGEEIDYHFYGRAVLTLNDVFVNPTNIQAAKRLGDIVESASENNSVGKQVLGGLLITFGALLIGASVVGFITTFGSSSVLSGWGFALGLSLLETEFVFGVASSVVAAAGVGLTFFAGPKALESGSRKGLSQEFTDIKKSVENYDEPPPAYNFAVSSY